VGLGGLGIDVREARRGMAEEFVTKFVVRAMAPTGSAARLGVVKVQLFFTTFFICVTTGTSACVVGDGSSGHNGSKPCTNPGCSAGILQLGGG